MNSTQSANSASNNVIAQQNPVRIGAQCVARIDDTFLLLVEIEVQVPGEDIEQVLIIRLTPAQAAALIPVVGLCRIVSTIPTPAPGRDVDFICAFVLDGNVFLVFDIETSTTDELVLVRAPLCPIVG